MLHKQLGILKLRPVIGVGVDDELRIRDVLLHDEGVDGGHDHVVTAVHDECWLLDRLQIAVGPVLLDAPLVHRFNLGGRNLVVHLGIASLLTKMLALPQPSVQPRRSAPLSKPTHPRLSVSIIIIFQLVQVLTFECGPQDSVPNRFGLLLGDRFIIDPHVKDEIVGVGDTSA